MKKLKTSLACLLAMVLLVSLAACGAAGGSTAAPAAGEVSSGSVSGPAAGEVNDLVGEFDMINSKDDIAAPLEALVVAFNEKYPNVKVTIETLSSNTDAVIQSRDAAGDIPDIMPVFNLGERGLRPWIDAGKIQSVSDLAVFKELPDNIKNMVTTDAGDAYCFVLSTTAYPIIYNKALFEQAGIAEVPQTLSEMEAACKKLKDAGITPFIAGAKDGWTVSNQIWRSGLDAFFPKEWLDKMDAGDASFKDYGYDIFNFLDIFIANTQEKPLDTDYMTQLALFAEGEGAMICQGPWAYNNLMEFAPEMADAYGAFAIPFHDDAAKNKMFVMQEMAYMVSAQADMAAIDAFFGFVVQDPVGREIFGKELNVMNPFGIENDKDPVLADISTYVDAGNYVFDTIDNNRSSEFFMVDSTNMQDYMGGKINQDQVLENMDQAWVDASAKAA